MVQIFKKITAVVFCTETIMALFWTIPLLVLSVGFLSPSPGFTQQVRFAESGEASNTLIFGRAAMCEAIHNAECQNPAIVFSITIGRVSCYTSFDSVPGKMFIYHNWYREDRLITTKRLSLQPPKWSTFSSIQLREADKGPWRVEIKDQSKRLLDTLRFSITE